MIVPKRKNYDKMTCWFCAIWTNWRKNI